MSIEELLRFLSYTMKFDAMVIEAVTDKLKEYCTGNAKLPDNAVNKLRKKAWASFWRKQNSPAKLWIGFTWSRSGAKLSTTTQKVLTHGLQCGRIYPQKLDVRIFEV